MKEYTDPKTKEIVTVTEVVKKDGDIKRDIVIKDPLTSVERKVTEDVKITKDAAGKEIKREIT